MKVEMSNCGTLQIEAENDIEEFALSTWINNSMQRINQPEFDAIRAGSFNIVTQSEKDLIDTVIEREELYLELS